MSKPIYPDNCPIRTFTADGKSAGRCMYYCPDAVCPRHGDVLQPLTRYRMDGTLTDERDFLRRRQESQ